MKKLILITILFFSIAGMAQTRTHKPKPKAKAAVAKPTELKDLAEIMIPKGRLMEAKSLKDLIVLPKGCNVSGYSFSCNQLGSLHEFQVKGGKLNDEILGLFKKGHANQVYVFERVKASCKVKKRYEVIVKP